jgi:hypothetical protein
MHAQAQVQGKQALWFVSSFQTWQESGEGQVVPASPPQVWAQAPAARFPPMNTHVWPEAQAGPPASTSKTAAV